MTPRDIYYKEDHSCMYKFSMSEEMSEGMKLWLIDVLGGTSPGDVSTVIEHWSGTSEAGHVQDMIYFKAEIDGLPDMNWYASTVHDMENKHSEVLFYMMNQEEWDAHVITIQEKGLELKYPL